MKITRIQLKNWKNFKDIDVPLSDRVFLIGPNASGKSNFLNALRFMRDVAESGIQNAGSNHLSNVLDLSSPNRKERAILVFTLDEDWKYELEINLLNSGRGAINQIIIEREVVSHKEKVILTRPDEKDKDDPARLMQTALEQVSANKEFRNIVDFFKSIVYRNILPQAIKAPQYFTSNKILNDHYGQDIILQIGNTEENIRDFRLERISKVLQSVVPNFSSLSIFMFLGSTVPRLMATHINNENEKYFSDEKALSDGTLRLIALLWTLLEAKGPVLLEEPEISLHGAVIEKLPSIFAQMIRTNKDLTQIFVSTHSEILLSDQGIGHNEILRLQPDADGTKIILASEIDKELLDDDLTPAEVFIPQTRPKDIDKLGDL